MLTLFNPFNEFAKFDDIMRRSAFAPSVPATFRPAVDVVEEKDAFVVTAELAGVKPDDIEINVEGNTLTISGERRSEIDETNDGYRRVERIYGSFRRSFTLPEGVDQGAIAADSADGVLTVRIPKAAEAKPKKITVKPAAKKPQK